MLKIICQTGNNPIKLSANLILYQYEQLISEDELMRHPFDLDSYELEPRELDFSEEITSEEAANVGGGFSVATTRAFGEEGGDDYPIDIKPIDGPIEIKPIDGPIATTLALGEEGGCYPEPWPIKPPVVTTHALGEEGGYSTMAIGEEGGCEWIC